MKRSLFALVAVMAVAALGAMLIATGTPAGQAIPMAMLLTPPDFGGGNLALIGVGGLILNAETLSIINKGFKTVFNNAFAGVKPMWNQVAMKMPSNTGEEQYGWLGASTQFREWLGDRVIQNLKVHDYTIKNKKFENTVGVKADAIKDDQYGVYSPLIAQLGQDAAQHPDQLIFALIQAGFAALCYDGQYFFDTDHPVGSSEAPASVSNFGGGAGSPWYLLDTSRMLKPFILQMREDYSFANLTQETDPNVFMRDEYLYGAKARLNVGFGLWQLAYASKQTLDVTNYSASRAAMASFKSDTGKPLGVLPNILLVGPSNEGAALNITTAERLANGQDNVYKGTAKVVMCPWLP